MLLYRLVELAIAIGAGRKSSAVRLLEHSHRIFAGRNVSA
jgi:hypothetical protein